MLQVKLFDCDHEEDLEEELNEFLGQLRPTDIVDVKYNVAAIGDAGSSDQIYCFTAMVMYVK